MIKSPEVLSFLAQCKMPPRMTEISLSDHVIVEHERMTENPVRHIVTVDSGYQEVAVQKEFPSSQVCFFQFGALFFGTADLESLERRPFVDPADISKLKQIERFKLVLPTKNIAMQGQPSLTASVRIALHEFFARPIDGTTLLETLRWFIFEEYGNGVDTYDIASCPVCDRRPVAVIRERLSSSGRFDCEHCGAKLSLVDVFRLHEAIDDDLGASGVLGYITTLIEQLIVVHFVRLLLLHRPALLRNLLFIKDGPLAFFGQTANMHKKMRSLVRHLFERQNFLMVGLEKSGAFVEHAAEVASLLRGGTALLLDNEYIYRYIVPGRADAAAPYGGTTYYGTKLIYKSREGGVYVATVPTTDVCARATLSDCRNLQTILDNLEKLRCDMYDDALIPIALVNKLVSLANRPSAKLLERFASDTVGRDG